MIAVWAFVAAMAGNGEAHVLFSVGKVVGMCFGGERFGERGELEEMFNEQRVGEMSRRVGVERREDGWGLLRVSVHI